MATFNQLFEGMNLSEEALEQINEAWESRLSEAREELTSELREEFSQRYDHDKSLIVEAVDNFISESLAAEITELVEDRQSLAEEKVKYRTAVSEHVKVLDRFVAETLAHEVKELHEDRIRIAEALGNMDEFVTENLAAELTEFHEDKKALASQRVKMIREGKKELADAKKDFIIRAAAKTEAVINETMKSEITSLKEDITAARENDFGRKIFEAFASEFGVSHLNESKEISMFQKSLADMEQRLAEAHQEIANREEKVNLTESKLRATEDRMQRKEKLNELLKPLSREKREIMGDLLESVKTNNLDKAFNKYVSSVVGTEKTRTKKSLTESVVTKEHTGDKVAPASAAAKSTNAESDAEIISLRKLAGL